jgi:hypothetical protein
MLVEVWAYIQRVELQSRTLALSVNHDDSPMDELRQVEARSTMLVHTRTSYYTGYTGTTSQSTHRLFPLTEMFTCVLVCVTDLTCNPDKPRGERGQAVYACLMRSVF